MAPLSLQPARYLDPRPSLEAEKTPFADAVNIPIAELPRRTHELPPSDEAIAVVGSAADISEAIAWLQSAGRIGIAAGPGDEISAEQARSQRRRLWRPSAFLEECAAHLTPGRALDLGCGVGRESVFLAARGWHVVGVDILPDAIERARRLEASCADACVPIDWQIGDLESESAPWTPQRPFDLLIGFRYLHRPLFARLRAWLAPHASVIYETFTTMHRARHGKPARDRFVLAPQELPTLLPGVEIRHYSEEWRGSAHTARIWAVTSG